MCRLLLTNRKLSCIIRLLTLYKDTQMLTKENYDDIKWDLMNYSTKGMWGYLPESTIEKVWDLLEKEIPFDSLVDYAGDNYGE